MAHLLHQPNGPIRLGDFLISHLNDPQWTEFRAAIAFVKKSGTQYVIQEIEDFCKRGSVAKISVGIDVDGTSKEGLEDLLTSVTNGEIYIFHNDNSSTFHPKVYLFKNSLKAEIVVGSGNLTSGGLFTNYEVSIVKILDLSIPDDLDLLNNVERVLDEWSTATPDLCYLLDNTLLAQLLVEGWVMTEAQMNIIRATASNSKKIGVTKRKVSSAPLFRRVIVPKAPPGRPRVTTTKSSSSITSPSPGAVLSPPTGVSNSYVMTLQNTDVGKGQITAGTSPRSPEVFIPLVALDADESFWEFPNEFAPDHDWNAINPERRNGHGKLDRTGVLIRINGAPAISINMFFNPKKKDLRLRHEDLRSAGSIGDIILIQKVNPALGYSYQVLVAVPGTTLFTLLQGYCVNAVKSPSKKDWGYF